MNFWNKQKKRRFLLLLNNHKIPFSLKLIKTVFFFFIFDEKQDRILWVDFLKCFQQTKEIKIKRNNKNNKKKKQKKIIMSCWSKSVNNRETDRQTVQERQNVNVILVKHDSDIFCQYCLAKFILICFFGYTQLTLYQ